jgi:hypothetical protein
MHFSRIGAETGSISDGRIGLLTTRGSVIIARIEEEKMQPAEHAISEHELRIPRDRLIEQAHSLGQSLILRLL